MSPVQYPVMIGFYGALEPGMKIIRNPLGGNNPYVLRKPRIQGKCQLGRSDPGIRVEYGYISLGM